MTIGGGLAVLATSIAVTLLQSSLITQAQPRYQPVVTAIVHALTSGFFTLALRCAIGSLILGAAALLGGSRPWATAVSSRIRQAGTRRSQTLPRTLQ